MNHVPVVSSNIESLAHCAETQTLEVAFKGSAGKVGGLYQYTGVPAWVYTAMVNAPSIGAYFAKHVKSTYPASKLR